MWHKRTGTAGRLLVMALALLSCLCSLRLLYGESDDLLSSPVKHLENYRFNSQSPNYRTRGPGSALCAGGLEGLG
jgi:hypothetical protein